VHNLRTAVIAPDGRLVKAYSGNMWTPAELIADLKAAPAPAH
jgi:cytochrome oxidase Cu insertion factor (SCO1/SenC/PrrC family)